MILAHGGEAVLRLDPQVVVTVVLLGCFHGLNPGMGWLFAVSYGLQEKRRTAVLKALIPIGIGHELSVAMTAVAIVLFSSSVSQAIAVGVSGLVMMGFGAWLFFRKRHFRWVGMRLRPYQLAWWSFLMSTVTGAGLMLAPVLVGGQPLPADALVREALRGEVLVALFARGAARGRDGGDRGGRRGAGLRGARAAGADPDVGQPRQALGGGVRAGRRPGLGPVRGPVGRV